MPLLVVYPDSLSQIPGQIRARLIPSLARGILVFGFLDSAILIEVVSFRCDFGVPFPIGISFVNIFSDDSLPFVPHYDSGVKKRTDSLKGHKGCK